MAASFISGANGSRIAYVRTAPQAAAAAPPGRAAGIMFCPGLLSHMQGTKALTLESFVKQRLPSCSYLRFDYTGHGQSSGTFTGMHLRDWFDDALLVLDQLTDRQQPQVIVGSSMGGLIALHLALQRPDRVAALILVAPAIGFIERRRQALSADQWSNLLAGKTVSLGSDYVDTGSDEVNLGFFEAARGFDLPETPGAVGVTCPVRILHGALDDVVPVAVSHQLVRQLAGGDVALTVVKDGDHRMSTPRDIEMLEGAMEQVLRQLQRTGGG